MKKYQISELPISKNLTSKKITNSVKVATTTKSSLACSIYMNSFVYHESQSYMFSAPIRLRTRGKIFDTNRGDNYSCTKLAIYSSIGPQSHEYELVINVVDEKAAKGKQINLQ